jgi:hypothetical protein
VMAPQPTPKRARVFACHWIKDDQFAGLDVVCCRNSFPMPGKPTLLEPPFHVTVPCRIRPDPSPQRAAKPASRRRASDPKRWAAKKSRSNSSLPSKFSLR